MKHTHGNSLSENQTFRAIEPIVDATHLPATVDT